MRDPIMLNQCHYDIPQFKRCIKAFAIPRDRAEYSTFWNCWFFARFAVSH